MHQRRETVELAASAASQADGRNFCLWHKAEQRLLSRVKRID